MREAQSNRLLVVRGDEANKGAYVLGQGRHAGHDLVDGQQALGRHIARRDNFRDDTRESTATNFCDDNAAEHDRKTVRQPVVE